MKSCHCSSDEFDSTFVKKMEEKKRIQYTTYCRQKCFCSSQQGLLWPSLLKQEPLFFTWMIQSIIRKCVFVFPPTKPFLSPLLNTNQSYLVFFVQSLKRTDLIKKREIFWHLSLLLISKRGWGEKKKKILFESEIFFAPTHSLTHPFVIPRPFYHLTTKWFFFSLFQNVGPQHCSIL